jgi:deoxyhypusine synthase
MKKNILSKKKKGLLHSPVEHIDIKKINTVKIIESMGKMSFTSRDTANAAKMYEKMIKDNNCVNILTLAGSTSAAGCMQIYVDLVRSKMIDVVVATGASIVDMDFFEALGFKHYQGTSHIDDKLLRSLYIDRIYDTYINEDDLQECDKAICKIADSLEHRPYSSQEFIYEMGRYLTKHSKKKNSLVQTAYEMGVPIFCPAFSDSSAGFGLVLHQVKNPKRHVSIDSVKDFHQLTDIKIKAKSTGLFMIGGGAPKNFAQDTVVCAEILGHKVSVHKYAIQITVADSRDGACSSSTLKEANSWGKVDATSEQMVFAEATSVLPLIASYVYHKSAWEKRTKKNFNTFLAKKYK